MKFVTERRAIQTDVPACMYLYLFRLNSQQPPRFTEGKEKVEPNRSAEVLSYNTVIVCTNLCVLIWKWNPSILGTTQESWHKSEKRGVFNRANTRNYQNRNFPGDILAWREDKNRI